MASRGMALWVAGAALGVGALAGVAIVGASLAGGGTEEAPGAAVGAVTPTMSPFGTPRPPSSEDPTGPVITQAPVPTAAEPTSPPYVTISGVDIPLPPGSHYYHGGCCEARVLHYVWFGDFSGGREAFQGIEFDDTGLFYSQIPPEFEGTLEPTLDALWELTKATTEPAPATVLINAKSVPLPVGSYVRVEHGPSDLNIDIYTIRYHHSAFLLDRTGAFNVSVSLEDAPALQATLTAAQSAAEQPVRTA